MSQAEAISFEAFQAMLAELLCLNAALCTPDAYFITDLGVDSLRLAEILLCLEELGIEISEDLAWEIQTVGDAYEYYARAWGIGEGKDGTDVVVEMPGV